MENLFLPAIYIPEQKVEKFCFKHKVKRLSLYGSVLRKDFSAGSDIDILIEFDEDQAPSLFSMVALEKELSIILEHRKIDLKTQKELSLYFREAVLKTAYVIYEKEE